jgi:alpha-glucosidase
MGIHQQGSYLLFYDNSYDARFDFRPQEPRNQNNSKPDCQVRFEGGMLRYYFIAGSPRQILERFTELTGRAELPPRWSLGYHQSRWGYRSEADIREVVQGFKAREMPLSAIHLDIDYMDGYRVFTVDKNRFPDLSALADDLLAQGIRLVPIIDPGVKIDPQYHVYQEGLKAGLYVRQPDGEPLKGVVWPGWCVFPDFTRPEARRWWGAYYPALLDSGMAGIWHDMNEPAAFTTGAGLTISLAGKHSIEGAEGDHLQAHNLYGLLMNRSAHQAMKKHKPERRPWILSRSGWVSQQRFAWNWMGDSESTWASLRMTITQTLGLGLSGQPYTGPDIGGFSGSPDAELYLRWFQAAAFLPFFRTHAAIGTARREPWIYGEPTTSVIRTYLRLRYQLMPYLYTLAWQASQSGTPLIRPLFWLENDRPEFWKAVQQETGDAFLLGDSLLVAPIFEPGASSRTVHLPTGCWYDFWNDTFYTGGQTVQVAVTLENIPVFVRGGSLLPLDSEGQLNLNLFAPGLDPQTPFTSLLYSDAGDGYGDFRIDRFNLTRNKEYLELDWLSEGVYPFPYNDVQIHLHGFAARSAWIDRQFVQIQDQVLHTQSFSKARFEG